MKGKSEPTAARARTATGDQRAARESGAAARTRAAAAADDRDDELAALRQQLRRSEQQLRRMFRANPQPMWIYDEETLRFLSVNDAAILRYGWSREEFLRMTIADIRPPADRERLRACIASRRHEGLRDAGNWRHLRRDGSLIDVRIYSHAVDYHGRPARLVHALDIGARRQRPPAAADRLAQATLDSLSQHVALLDCNGTLVAVNQAWRSFAALNAPASAAVAEGANYLAVCDAAVGDGADEAQAFAAAIREIAAGTRSEFRLEYRCHAPAERRWFVGRVARLIGDGPLHLVVTHAEITQRKLAEMALAARETQFRATFEQAAVGLAHVAPDGRWLRVNQRLCEIAGYSREELLQSRFQDITHPDDLARDLALVAEMLAGRRTTCALEKRYVRKDGGSIWIYLTVALVRQADGAPAYFVSVVEDITERKRAQNARDDSERLMRTVLETLPIGVWLQDATGQIVLGNSAGQRIWAGQRYVGIERFGEYRGWWADSGRLIGAHEWAAARAIERGETSLNEVIDIECFDGTRKTILNSAVPMRDDAGAITGAIIVNQDVTEHRQAQRRVEESEARLRLALAAACQGIYDLDVQTGAAVVTPEYARMLGYEPDEFVESNDAWIARLHPDDRGPVAQAYRDYVDGWTREYRVEFRQRTKNGDWRWILSMGRIIERDADGRPRRMLGTHTDITERKRAEEELRKFYRAVEQSSESIVIADRSARIEYVNEAFTRIAGYARAEVLGRNPRLLQSGRTPRSSYEQMWAALTRGEPWSGELYNRRKDGSEYVEAAVITPIRQPDGTVDHYVAVKEDITEKRRVALELERHRHHLEELVAARTRQLQEVTLQAEAANQAKSEFLANMSHEIRTPMNGVLGMLEVLERSPLTAPQAELVRTAGDSGRTLLALIDDILDLSKIEAGRLQIEPAPVALAELVEALCETLAPVADRRGVDLSVFVDPALPAQVVTDGLRLRQILLNLVGNALKFSGGRADRRGRVGIGVTAAPAAAAFELAFRVEDNGIGMTADQVQRLFAPFSQAEASTTRRFGGSGLGLSICKRLADLMGGHIAVDSRPGAGSTFTLTLPVAPVAAAATPERDLAGIRCSVVDMPALDAAAIGRYLAWAGAAVTRCADLAGALQAAAASAGDVVVVHHLRLDAPPDPLLAAAPPNVRLLLLTQGLQGEREVEADGVVSIGATAIRRGRLLAAVAAAAGGEPAQRAHAGAAPGTVPAATVPDAEQCGELILVAEDDEINRLVIRRQLELLGRTAEFAHDGATALAKWRSGRYGLLLTDLHMPGIDGYELAATVRRLEADGEPADGTPAGRPRRVPILALTANALRGEADRARAMGMDDYLTKPLRIDVLRAALDRWLPPAAGARDFDPAALRGLIGDDPADAREFLQAYLESSRRLRGALADACDQADLAAVERIAHRLKSSARAIGAGAAADRCAEAEAACATADRAAALAAARAAESRLAGTEAAVVHHLAANGG